MSVLFTCAYISDSPYIAEFAHDGILTFVELSAAEKKGEVQCTIHFRPGSREITFVDYTRGLGVIRNPLPGAVYKQANIEWKKGG